MQQLKANLPQAIIYPPNKGRRKRTNLKLLQFIKQTIGCCNLSKKPQVAAACSLSKNTQVVAIYPKKKKNPQVAALNEWKRLKHLQNHEI